MPTRFHSIRAWSIAAFMSLSTGCHLHMHVGGKAHEQVTAAPAPRQTAQVAPTKGRLGKLYELVSGTKTNSGESHRLQHANQQTLLLAPPAKTQSSRPSTLPAISSGGRVLTVTPGGTTPSQPTLRQQPQTNRRVLRIDGQRIEELPPPPHALKHPTLEMPTFDPFNSRTTFDEKEKDGPGNVPETPPHVTPIEDAIPPATSETVPAPGVESTSPVQSQPFVPLEQLGDGAYIEGNIYPIGLSSALRLAGIENLDVRLAAERINEARARLTGAKWMWLPSFSAGAAYSRHEGEIQLPNGDIANVNRHSIFLGGGGHVGTSPIAGGTSSPGRMYVDLSLTDVIYKPLVEKQLVAQKQARHTAEYQQTLEEVAHGYYDLVLAQQQVANAKLNLTEARELMSVIQIFVSGGVGSQADVTRMKTEVSIRRQALVEAELNQKLASAELCRLLRLEPDTSLVSIEDRVYEVEMVSTTAPMSVLLSQAVCQRPDLISKHRQLAAIQSQRDAENARPYLPSVYLGNSTGVLGGGRNTDLHSLDLRKDMDAMVVWDIKNFGMGVNSARRQAESRVRQSIIEYHRLRERIKSEVARAYHQAQAKSQQIKIAEESARAARKAHQEQSDHIQDMKGLPLESLASLQSVAETRARLVDAITAYNKAQVSLLKSIGLTPEDRVIVDGMAPSNVHPMQPVPATAPSGPPEHVTFRR